MGVMCVVWRYRLTLSIILALVVCGVYASDGGKVYPRGNHWAVGHLMGKKSIDDQGRFGERFIDQDDLDPGFLHSPAQLLKGRPEQMSAHGSALETSPLLRLLMANVRQWVEEQERERQLKQEEQIFLQALGMKDESS